MNSWYTIVQLNPDQTFRTRYDSLAEAEERAQQRANRTHTTHAVMLVFPHLDKPRVMTVVQPKRLAHPPMPQSEISRKRDEGMSFEEIFG